ncbi:hypothetical protein [Haemophilus influenzae]|uniref:hypothetical protein n=1 Tax=Haemophilus influenzae TaxID=727 RepID=UPI003DA52025
MLPLVAFVPTTIASLLAPFALAFRPITVALRPLAVAFVPNAILYSYCALDSSPIAIELCLDAAASGPIATESVPVAPAASLYLPLLPVFEELTCK